MSAEEQFNFKSVSEEEERLDYNHLEPCPNCKKPIAYDATICYFCSQDVSRQGKTTWVGWIAAGLVIIFILALIFNF